MTRSGTHASVSGVTIIVSAYAHHQGQFLYLVLVLNNPNQNTEYLHFFLIRTTCSNLKYLY